MLLELVILCLYGFVLIQHAVQAFSNFTLYNLVSIYYLRHHDYVTDVMWSVFCRTIWFFCFDYFLNLFYQRNLEFQVYVNHNSNKKDTGYSSLIDNIWKHIDDNPCDLNGFRQLSVRKLFSIRKVLTFVLTASDVF